MAEKHGVREMFLRTVAVVGLVAVLLLGAWGIILLAFNLPGVVGSLGGSVAALFTTSSNTKESLSATAPASAASGQPLTLAWSHQGESGQFAYSVSYACTSGLSFKAPLPTGSYQKVDCEVPFNYVNASEHMTLIPSGSGTATFTVSAKRLSDGVVTTSGTASTVVSGAASPSTSSGQASAGQTSPSYTYVPATRVTQLYGLPDLTVRITSAVPTYTGRTSVQFVVENVGTNVAPRGWTLSAQLPLNPPYTYSSPTQQALYPGDKIVYTLAFDGGAYNYGGCQYQTYPYQNLPSGQAGCYNNYSYNNYGNYSGGTCYYYDGGNNYPAPCSNSGYYSTNYYNQYPYLGGGNNYYGNGVVTITVDPWNTLYETNEGNNTASTYLRTY